MYDSMLFILIGFCAFYFQVYWSTVVITYSILVVSRWFLISKRIVSYFVLYTKYKLIDMIEVRGSFLLVTQFISNNQFLIFHLRLTLLVWLISPSGPVFSGPVYQLLVLAYISTATQARHDFATHSRQNKTNFAVVSLMLPLVALRPQP